MLAAKTFFETPSEQLTPRMEEDFFTSLMTRNKIYKTTFHNRFSDINTCLLNYLLEHGPQAPKVLDVGVSSGISTVELYDDLCEGGLEVDILATDILINAFLVRVFPGCYALVDPDGFPLRFDLPFGTLKPWVARNDYYTGLFVLRKLLNAIFTRQARRVLQNANDPRVSEVDLITPRALARSGITVCADDITKYNDAFDSSYDFIRVANVLNRGYFDTSTLSLITSNIVRYMRAPNSSLLVVRTHEDHANHGTLFRMGHDKRLEIVKRFGLGSEVEDIVLRAAVIEQR